MGLLANISINEFSIQLQKGDRLLLFTDGLVECVNEKGEYFLNYLKDNILKESKKFTNSEFKKEIYNNLLTFKGNAPFDDDICFICLDIK